MTNKAIVAVASVVAGLVLGACGEQGASTATPAVEAPRFEFSRMLVHWSQYIDPGYLEFVEEVEPEVVQVGFYGVDFWALAHVPKEVKGRTAATHAVDGDLKASAAFLDNLNAELHKRGVKVVGHIDTTYHVTGLIDGPEGPREGFFKFYNELWDEAELGPKPVKDPLELIQRKADGSPYVINLEGFSPWPIYHGCLNNPHWRTILKAFVKRGIERGLDGFVINYFYTNGCMCEHCQRGFRAYLRERYTAAELRKQFGIDDLDAHKFAEINGWYKPNEMTPLRLEGQKFADLSRKSAFDEVFIEYGRSLKPGLLLAQWLHSYQPMARNDERMMLPPELWARGEDYLWYCVGRNEPTLQLRYMRGAGGDRPYTICHYEHVKVRASMAELAANGGAPMTRHADFNNPDSRRELVRFFEFMKRYNDLYDANRMAGEAVVLYPRSQIQAGRFTDALSAFHALGDRLLDDHVLFDVIPDDLITPEQLAGYKRVFAVSSAYELGEGSYDGLSRFEGPKTVRVSANRPADGEEIDIHFVNYARNEPGEKDRKGFVADENPVAVTGMKADLAVPGGYRVAKVEFISPEAPEAAELAVEQQGGRAKFALPEMLVYGIARVYLERAAVSEAAGGAEAGALTGARGKRVGGAARPVATAEVARYAGAPRAEEECDPTSCGHPAGSHAAEHHAEAANYVEDVKVARAEIHAH